MSKEFQEALYAETVICNPYIPIKPTERQAEFLRCFSEEAFYGGSAGGGKSSALLMAALQFADVENYAAIIFRRTFADLALPGALMAKAHEWLSGTPAKWLERDKRWTFPSGASLSFGYLQTSADRYRMQSSEFQFCAFDELTSFPEEDYRFLFSRLRRLTSSEVPLRMRAASNPGNAGHAWVKARFMTEGPAAGRVFVPAKLDDNPFLDRAAYIASLNQLSPILRAQLLSGDWSVVHGGSIFQRGWLHIAEAAPDMVTCVRAWDFAATAEAPGKDPDHTAGVLLGRATDGSFWILDVRRIRATPSVVQNLVLQTAALDGKQVSIWLEMEPGSAGIYLADSYANALAGYTVHSKRPTGDKVARASPVSSIAEAGRMHCLRRPWTSDLLDELEAFPQGGHDDQVDSLSAAFAAICDARPMTPFRIVTPAEPDRPQQAAKLMGNVSRDALQKALNFGGGGGRPDWRGRNQQNDGLHRPRGGPRR